MKKNKLAKGLLAVGAILGVLTTVNVAEAAYATHCTWVSGHYAGGFWRPAHRVCWGYNYHPRVNYGPVRCSWVSAHRAANGYWVPAHRVCWR